MLKSFLDKKTLYYDKIDYDVVSTAWDILKSHIKIPFVIHIVGTNGKGSTGRYLAHILSTNNYQVLHYSSPHILEFNERIWINGNNSSNDTLDKAHFALIDILPKDIIDKLTYFEYATLLALYLSDGLDFLVLEAGLGGEFDATNVVKNDLSLFTTIGLDHTEFLGDTIEQIASTKLRSCDHAYILAKQLSIEVLSAKEKVLKDKYEIVITKQNISNIKKQFLQTTMKLPKYLENNLDTVITALLYLNKIHKINLDTFRFSLPILFGRSQKISQNITLDVGHNTLAATVLLREFYGQKITLIYNSYKDKNYQEVLQILKPILLEVQILQIDDSRIVDEEKIMSICHTLDIDVKKYDKIDPNKKYLVFGSFKVAEEFLKQNPNIL